MRFSRQNQKYRMIFSSSRGQLYRSRNPLPASRIFRTSMLVKEHPNPSNFGVVMLKRGLCVESIVEKPEHSPSFMVSTGIYSFKKDVFSYITGK